MDVEISMGRRRFAVAPVCGRQSQTPSARKERLAGTYQSQVSLQRAPPRRHHFQLLAGCTDIKVLVGWLEEPLMEGVEWIHPSGPFQGTRSHFIRAPPAVQTPGAILWNKASSAQGRILISGVAQAPERGTHAAVFSSWKSYWFSSLRF